jgi:hypothetical protein
VRVGDGVIGVADIATNGVAVGLGVGDERVTVAPTVGETTCRAATRADVGVTVRTGVPTAVAPAITVPATDGVAASGVPVSVVAVADTPTVATATVRVTGTIVGCNATVAVAGRVTPRGGAMITRVDPTAVRTDPL